MRKALPTAIDLFAGAGGMSLGFKQAGFRVIGAFELEQRNVETYRQNFPSAHVHQADLSECSGKELLTAAQENAGQVDVIFGGPPCQGFSYGGKRDLHDERNLLIYDFARIVREIQPKYFVLENVHGLLSGHARDVVNSFIHRVRLAGYRVVDDIRVLNAADYGVPQRRKRTFILGCQTELTTPRYPEPASLINEDGSPYSPTVWDAISDLPDIDKYDNLFDRDCYDGALGTPSHYAKLMRNEIKEESDRFIRRRAMPTSLTGCLRTDHSKATTRRFSETKPGTAEPVSRYYRLHKHLVSPTIRAGTGSDHGSHTAPRPIHPERPRCITVREAARLHSFPDWYQFHSTRWHSFRQIGNSVPPRLARFVANSISTAIQENQK